MITLPDERMPIRTSSFFDLILVCIESTIYMTIMNNNRRIDDGKI